MFLKEPPIAFAHEYFETRNSPNKTALQQTEALISLHGLLTECQTNSSIAREHSLLRTKSTQFG